MNSDERGRSPVDLSPEGGSESGRSAIRTQPPAELSGKRGRVDEALAAERREVGDAESSSKHPPHVARHEADAPIQKESPSPTAVPVLPANAAGRDSATADEQDEEVDPESMYDRRPERFADSPPSERPGPEGR